jgi:hypothetical protein
MLQVIESVLSAAPLLLSWKSSSIALARSASPSLMASVSARASACTSLRSE